MTQLSNNVMRRVRIIWAVKTYGPIGMKVVVLGLGLWVASFRVSFGQVWQNWQGKTIDIAKTYSFLKSAFLETEFLVQVLALVLAAFSVLLIRDIVRNIKEFRSFVRQPSL